MQGAKPPTAGLLSNFHFFRTRLVPIERFFR